MFVNYYSAESPPSTPKTPPSPTSVETPRECGIISNTSINDDQESGMKFRVVLIINIQKQDSSLDCYKCLPRSCKVYEIAI